jgi:hypothetical protein
LPSASRKDRRTPNGQDVQDDAQNSEAKFEAYKDGKEQQALVGKCHKRIKIAH